MIQHADPILAELYEEDETAWLEAMADLIEQGRRSDLDFPHLREYLTDMARRDRREVASRLRVLLAHVLKWQHQPDKRTRSWHGTIVEQRQQLAWDAARGVLRNHAESALAEMYAEAVEQAAVETGLDATSFPAKCPWTLDQLLSPELLKE